MLNIPLNSAGGCLKVNSGAQFIAVIRYHKAIKGRGNEREREREREREKKKLIRITITIHQMNNIQLSPKIILITII